jgi:hypothetical protein
MMIVFFIGIGAAGLLVAFRAARGRSPPRSR